MCGPGVGTLWVPEVKKQLEHTSQPINLAHVLSFLSHSGLKSLQPNRKKVYSGKKNPQEKV